ncbi:MAG TPA: beta-N-acetylglucosaminidase, partial [Maribacter sp.]|nr:beta-N-acetylglucosaminidase [Maribacter sp.]
KYKAGLHHYKPIKLENLYNDLNGLEDDIVYEQAIENAITVVKNKLDLLSIKNLDNKKIAYVKMGNSDNEAFVQGLKNYAKVTVIEASDITTLKTRLKEFNLIIVGHHMNNESPWKSYKFSNSELEWLQEIANERTS